MKRLGANNLVIGLVVLCACLALAIAFIVITTPSVGAPTALQNDSPSGGFTTHAIAGLVGIVIGLLLSRLGNLSDSFGKEETVPDWHVALIFKNRRFQRLVSVPTFHTRADAGETFVIYDLREQSLLIEHKCDTADQVSLEIKIDVLWQHTDKNDIHAKFLKESNDAIAAMSKAAKSIVSKQIAMRDYTRAMVDLKIIEAVLRADLPAKVQKYGIQINDVGLMEPRFNEAATQLVTASKAEAKRILILHEALTKTSDRTVDYLLKSQGHAPREG